MKHYCDGEGHRKRSDSFQPMRDAALRDIIIEMGFLSRDQAWSTFEQARGSQQSLWLVLQAQSRLSAEQFQAALSFLADSGVSVEGNSTLTSVGRSSFTASSLPQVGDIIEGYGVLRLIGKGGMGAVYEVVKNQARYALKVIFSNDDGQLLRFEREAQSLAAMRNHSNIVHIHSYSRHGKFPFLIQDYIEGQSLAESLEAGQKFDENQAIEIILKVARALSVVHEEGYVHRDLKPANILIREQDGELFLTDFGLVKIIGDHQLTKSSDVIGTPHYMAPEQFEGRNTEIKPSTDVWALGVLFYRLLTGLKPFVGPSAVELLVQVCTLEPKHLTDLCDVSSDLEAIVMHALQKESAMRYQSAEAFAQDCERFLTGHRIKASSATHFRAFPARILRRFGQLSILFFATMSVLMIAAIIGIAWLWQNNREKDAQRAKLQGARTHLFDVVKKQRSTFGKHIAKHLVERFEGFSEHDLLSSPKSSQCRINLATQLHMKAFQSVFKKAREGGYQKVAEDICDTRNRRKVRQWVRFVVSCEQILSHLPLSNDKTRLPATYRDFLRGLKALDAKDWDLAAELFEDVSQQKQLKPLALLASALAMSGSRQWTEMERKLGALSDFADYEYISKILLKAIRIRILVQSAISPKTTVLELRKSLLALEKRLDLRGEDLWFKLNNRLQIGFNQHAARNSLKKTRRTWLRLELLERAFDRFRCPIPTPDLCLLLAKDAKEKAEKARTFRFYILLKAQKANYTIPEGVSVRDQMRLSANVFNKITVEDVFKLALAASRVGYYVIRFDEKRFAALRKKKVLELAVMKAPRDPYAKFWRALSTPEIFEVNSGEELAYLELLNQAKEDLDFVLSRPNVHAIYRCQALELRAFCVWKQSKLLNRVIPIQAISVDFKNSLRGPHPEPDRVYLAQFLLEKSVVPTKQSIERLDLAALWLRRRFKQCEHVLQGKPAIENRDLYPLLPVAFANQLAGVFNSKAVFLDRLGESGKALEAINKALRLRVKNKRIISSALIILTKLGRAKEARALLDERVDSKSSHYKRLRALIKER
jgi:serine/threonine protein kinase